MKYGHDQCPYLGIDHDYIWCGLKRRVVIVRFINKMSLLFLAESDLSRADSPNTKYRRDME